MASEPRGKSIFKKPGNQDGADPLKERLKRQHATEITENTEENTTEIHVSKFTFSL